MSKLSRFDLDWTFTNPRFDHPGRRGGQFTAEPLHRDPFARRRSNKRTEMYLIHNNGVRPIRNRVIGLAEQMAAEAFGKK